MANPIHQVISAVGTGAIIVPDWMASPFNLTAAVDVSQAVGAVFGVFFTTTDPTGWVVTTPGAPTLTPLWRNDQYLPPGSSASGVSLYNFPIMGLKIVVTALTSGSIVFDVIQGMNGE